MHRPRDQLATLAKDDSRRLPAITRPRNKSHLVEVDKIQKANSSNKLPRRDHILPRVPVAKKLHNFDAAFRQYQSKKEETYQKFQTEAAICDVRSPIDSYQSHELEKTFMEFPKKVERHRVKQPNKNKENKLRAKLKNRSISSMLRAPPEGNPEDIKQAKSSADNSRHSENLFSDLQSILENRLSSPEQ